MHIDHIGIAVADLEAAVKTYETVLNTTCTKREVVESEKVETAFFQTGESKVELLGATSEDSVIAKYVAKKVRVCTMLLSKWTTFSVNLTASF